jgi:16S rRNA (cytosine1402-N4)-methyltransferase
MHIPVLQSEVLEHFNPKPNENFVDCTAGFGGHAIEILKRTAPRGKLLAIDLDAHQIQDINEQLKTEGLLDRAVLVNDNYANLQEIVSEKKFKNISGILLDLGFSSWHVDKSERGFTFLKNEPLDMRYDLRSQLTAEKILNFWSERDIEKILREYGEESFSSQIARGIVEARRIVPIKKTLQLVEVVKRAILSKARAEKIHFATKTFQALRIAVNEELENLKKILPQTLNIINSRGKLAIISFHSLEDAIVKDFFNNEEKKGSLKIMTKKPQMALTKEVLSNPRARSAKLRVAEIIKY